MSRNRNIFKSALTHCTVPLKFLDMVKLLIVLLQAGVKTCHFRYFGQNKKLRIESMSKLNQIIYFSQTNSGQSLELKSKSSWANGMSLVLYAPRGLQFDSHGDPRKNIYWLHFNVNIFKKTLIHFILTFLLRLKMLLQNNEFHLVFPLL